MSNFAVQEEVAGVVVLTFEFDETAEEPVRKAFVAEVAQTLGVRIPDKEGEKKNKK